MARAKQLDTFPMLFLDAICYSSSGTNYTTDYDITWKRSVMPDVNARNAMRIFSQHKDDSIDEKDSDVLSWPLRLCMYKYRPYPRSVPMQLWFFALFPRKKCGREFHSSPLNLYTEYFPLSSSPCHILRRTSHGWPETIFCT
jgi:hypothetical protein